MRLAIFDPAAGISGDMVLGALLDAGLSPEWLRELPGRLGYADVSVEIHRVSRAAIMATKVDFQIPQPGSHSASADGHSHGRTMRALMELVRAAPVSDWVRSHATRAFEAVAEAEGKVHGCAPGEVHFHEVGATDAVLDMIGAMEGIERLGVAAVHHLPIAVGNGWVDTEHGKLPVPAPATAELLAGMEVVSGAPVVGEATTPTGAAILRVLSQGPPPDKWRWVTSGWGAGGRDPEGYPNALRLILAETAVEAGSIEVIATDVDDLNPEYLEPLRRAVFEAGAVDCVAWPAQGKKGRVSMRIEALAPPASAAAVVEAIFRHSGTTGVRRQGMIRQTLERQEVTVDLMPGIRVRVKVWEGMGGGRRLKAEFDDILEAARQLDRPAHELARDAERRAEATLKN